MSLGNFKFKLGQSVSIDCSGEVGEVIGRAEYEADEDRYFIRYAARDGRATEVWWNESALTGNNKTTCSNPTNGV